MLFPKAINRYLNSYKLKRNHHCDTIEAVHYISSPVELAVTSLRQVPTWKNNRKRKHRAHLSTSTLQECWSLISTSDLEMAPTSRAAWQSEGCRLAHRCSPTAAHTQVQVLCWTHRKRARTLVCFKMACSSVIHNFLCTSLVEINHSPPRVQFLAFPKAPSWQVPASSSSSHMGSPAVMLSSDNNHSDGVSFLQIQEIWAFPPRAFLRTCLVACAHWQGVTRCGRHFLSQVSLRRGVSEAMVLSLHRAWWPPSKEAHWAQHTEDTFCFCQWWHFLF